MTMNARIPIAIVLTVCVAGASQRSVSRADGDWPSHGRDPGAQRYSPLTQITPGNVATLEQVWSFDTGATNLQVTPIVAGVSCCLSSAQHSQLQPASVHSPWPAGARTTLQSSLTPF